MAVYKLLIWPNKKLSKISEPIKVFNNETKSIIKNLIDTIKSQENNAAGLAAPQIGINKRIFIVNIDPEHNNGNGTNGYEYFINPEIIKQNETFTWEERCLSIPIWRGTVNRFKSITIIYKNLNGEIKKKEAQDYLSGCLQHELDHLDGKLWINYQSKLKYELIKRKMIKFKKLNNI